MTDLCKKTKQKNNCVNVLQLQHQFKIWEKKQIKHGNVENL